jgi:Flp pilus assembly protein TadB
VIPALAAGCLGGLGVFLLARGLAPPRPSLAVVLERVYGPGSEAHPQATGTGGWASRTGRSVAAALAALGVRPSPLHADLAVVGRSLEDHMAVRLGSALALAATAGTMHVALAVVGVALPPPALALAAAAAAIGGFLVPDMAVRRLAARRRREFRQGLAFFLDLMIVVLSGGGGPTTAVRLASEAGEGWVYRQLRQALAAGRIRRQEPWQVLADLGAHFDVVELEELGAAVSMAERQGASVRLSLAAKAAAIRDHQAAEAEAAARSATVRMAVPLVLLGLGFAALLLFGAMMSLLSAVAG